MHSVQPTSKNAAQIRFRETTVPGLALWKTLVAAIQRKIRLRRDLEHLNAMSDYQLYDIGIARDQIDTALRRGRRAFPPPLV